MDSLRLIGSTEAVETLLALLQDGDEPLRWQVARALGDFKSDAVVEALIKATERPFGILPAIPALARIGSDRAVERLITLMGDLIQNDAASYEAMTWLVRLGTGKAVDGLIEAWNSPVSIHRERLYFYSANTNPSS